MKYAQLIKHPLPPIIQEFGEYIEEMKKSKPEYYRMALYHAEILDGVLAITIFLYHNGYRSGKSETVIRHFYDGERYATQREADNKRLEGSISYYLEYSRHIRGLENADSVIKTYLKCTDKDKTGISALRDIEQKMLDEKLKIKHKKITDIVDMRMSAVPENPPDEFFGWVNDWVLKQARYFFYKYRKGKKQRGYCSHCRKEYEADNVRHNAKTVCPFCGSELTCKALGKVTQYTIRDSSTVAYVQEITENGSPALVERIYYIKQDIASHREGPLRMRKEVTYEEIKRIFLAPDKLVRSTVKGKYNTAEYVYGYFKGKGPLRWCAINDCPPASEWFNNDMWIYPGNINGIFKNSSIPKIKNIEASAVVPVFAKELTYLVKALKEMPVLENFAKLGLYNMLGAIGKKLVGGYYCGNEGTFRYLKSNYMTVYETLGIQKDILKKMGDITENEYLLYKRIEQIAPFKFETFKRYVAIGLCSENYSYTISTIIKDYRISAERFIGYLEKQKKRLKIKAEEVLNFYNDYLKMVKELRIPKTESVLFPTDVNKEHDRLMKIQIDREYENQNKMLKKRVKILEMLMYEDKDFIIRPLKNADEFLKESSILNHCVKTYIDDCAEGKTNIFGIRRAESPDVPYFTLELSNSGTVTHNLGKNNCYPPKEVNAFVKRWEKKVVEKNKQKFIEAANGKPREVRITA